MQSPHRLVYTPDEQTVTMMLCTLGAKIQVQCIQFTKGGKISVYRHILHMGHLLLHLQHYKLTFDHLILMQHSYHVTIVGYHHPTPMATTGKQVGQKVNNTSIPKSNHRIKIPL